MSFWTSLRKTQRIHPEKPALILLALLLILTPLHAGKIPCKFVTEAKIVAVADIHGDYDNFVKILRGTGLVDDSLDWIGGKTHLVQLGDILDRGDDAKQAFDLLMKLEKQAEAAGGMVHVLLGNHEEVNIVGVVFDTARYVTLAQFESFLPQRHIDLIKDRVRKKLESDQGANGKVNEAVVEKAYNDALQAELDKIPKKGGSQAYLKMDKWKKKKESWYQYFEFFHENYGKWLLTKNIAIKINDIVFVHGGFSEQDTFLDLGLQRLNDEARREYSAYAEFVIFGGAPPLSPPKFLLVPVSPQWDRSWARGRDNDHTTIDRVLSRLNANHMVVGHTVRDVQYIETQELSRFEEKVWAIDVGISKYYNNLLFALIITKGDQGSEFTPWWGDDENEEIFGVYGIACVSRCLLLLSICGGHC